jgi:hypothetical protein
MIALRLGEPGIPGGFGQRVSRRARAICAVADRPETSAVAARTAVLADLLLAMVSASQQSASAVASSQPRSGPGPRRLATVAPACDAGLLEVATAVRKRAGLVRAAPGAGHGGPGIAIATPSAG